MMEKDLKIDVMIDLIIDLMMLDNSPGIVFHEIEQLRILEESHA